MDRVLSFNILLADILGKENSDADFLSRMQTDANLTLQIKLTDHVPIREIEIETDGKSPRSFSNICENAPFSEGIQPVVDEHLINQMKTLALFDEFLAKQPTDDPDINIAGFCTFSLNPQVNPIETNDFEDILKDLPKRTGPLDLVQEQQSDEVIRVVISWKKRGYPVESPNLLRALRKYRK